MSISTGPGSIAADISASGNRQKAGRLVVAFSRPASLTSSGHTSMTRGSDCVSIIALSGIVQDAEGRGPDRSPLFFVVMENRHSLFRTSQTPQTSLFGCDICGRDRRYQGTLQGAIPPFGVYLDVTAIASDNPGFVSFNHWPFRDRLAALIALVSHRQIHNAPSFLSCPRCHRSVTRDPSPLRQDWLRCVFR